MYVRCICAIVCNENMPTALKRNADVDAEDNMCGSQNKDPTNLGDLYDIF